MSTIRHFDILSRSRIFTKMLHEKISIMTEDLKFFKEIKIPSMASTNVV